jgi:hypothetical protein
MRSGYGRHSGAHDPELAWAPLRRGSAGVSASEIGKASIRPSSACASPNAYPSDQD